MPRLLLGTLATAAVLLGACVIAGAALGATPIGSQFQVNTSTWYLQSKAAVAVDADGDFVVVWESYESAGSDTAFPSVQGQRYDASGNTIGGEFQINTYTTSAQRNPSVAVEPDGDFVVVWDSFGSAGSDNSGLSSSIQAQRYDSSGNTVGSEFQVNTYTTFSQLFPSVAVNADGDFVVVWNSRGSAGSDTWDFSIQGQRYDSSGNAVGGEFQINTYTSFGQRNPSVSIDSHGGFVVVWDSFGSTGSDVSYTSVQGQRYDRRGNTVGGEFQVNTYTTSDQNGGHTLAGPSVSVDPDGNFVVVWASGGSAGNDSSGRSIQAQRYDRRGNTVGSEFQVNTYTTYHQWVPSVAIDADGSFVIVWESDGSTGSDSSLSSVQGQRYDAFGNAIGSEFQVNTYTTSRQYRPSVALDSTGNFVVVWESDGSTGNDSDYFSIQGQRYLPEPSEFLMLAAGIAFLAAVGRRQIKA